MRKLAQILLVGIMMLLFTTFFVDEVRVSAATIVDSGTCGTNAEWTLDDEGTLVISGTGAIEENAFEGRTQIKSVTISEGITSIGDKAFYVCNRLTRIALPDSVTSIGDSAFCVCSSLTSIALPDSVTSIGNHAFRGCSSLTSIALPASVTSIGDYAFYGCRSLTSIALPDSITSIGDKAFYGCRSLTSIALPDSVTSIGDGAFSDCSAYLCLYVVQGSYAEEYAIAQNRNYEYYESSTGFGISASWQNITDTTEGKLTCKTGTNVELLITLKGVADSNYTVEIYKTDGTLVKTLSAADFAADNGLTYSFSTTFNAPGTEWYTIKYKGSDGSMKYIRSEQLVVRRADAATKEQLNALKSFAGTNVANFITGNVFVKQLDNGIVVKEDKEEVVYYEYLYDNGTDTPVSFFVRDTDKTLVTDYTILQKLWYVKDFRDRMLRDAETIKSITASFDAVLDGLKKYKLGSAASKLVGVAGNAYLTGGASFKSALAKGITDELTVENFLELVVVAKFKDYQSFMKALNNAVKREKSGHRTDLSDYDMIASYMCQLNSVSSNYGSTFELLKKLADIPDKDNTFLNWFSTFTDYLGDAISGLTFGLSDTLVDTASKALVESLNGATDVCACISNAYNIAFGGDITLASTSDISGLIIKCGTLIPGGDILDKVTSVSSNDWYGMAGNVIKYMLWAGQLSQVEEEVADYRQTTTELLETTLSTYDVIQKKANGFVNPELKLIKGFDDKLIYADAEYKLEFEITGTVKEIVHSDNVTVKSTGTVNEGVTTEYVTITITQSLPVQNIWLKFVSENDSSVKWESTIMLYETIAETKTKTIKYNSSTIGTDGKDTLNDDSPRISLQKAMTEIIEGLGGNDTIFPQYSGHSTNYLYYLGADNGHDKIYDYGGEDTIYIIGDNADINKVSISYNKFLWNIYYDNKLIITMNARIATQSYKDLKVAVAKKAEFRTGLFGSKSCIISGIETVAIRLPRFMSVAYCPIDVYVYDSEGNVVHVLRDGQESYAADGHGVFEVSYDETRGEYMKHVSLYDEEYSVEFIGNDEGVMEYQVTKTAEDGSIVTYHQEEIAISKDIVLTVDPDNLSVLTDSYGNTYEVEHVETIQCVYPTEEENNGVVDFVNRMYIEILDRDPDAGSQTWVDVLENGSYTGVQVAEGFIMSDEFINKEMSNEDFVQIMYRAFFGRDAATSEVDAWVAYLEQGYRKSFVFSGFANSNEFKALCEGYGVNAGSVHVTVSEQQPGLTDKEYNTWLFVERMYTEVLTRTPDMSGIKGWVDLLKAGTWTGAQVAEGFILSNEFLAKEMTNEEYVRIMYMAFFGREADPEGLAGWVNALETGSSKEFVFAGFTNSNEFGVLCNSYGITQGSVPMPER